MRIQNAVSLFLLSAMLVCVLGGCTELTSHKPDSAVGIPRPPREFRAAWVASVSNINWPSKPGLSVAEQKRQAIAILDTLEACRFNAVILQVRPECDALYPSAVEPWSRFLTGRQGQAPEPYYDPLDFWIEQAHDRGMELHAWFNPYRAHYGGGEPSPESIVNRRPELARRLANGMYWLDPTLKQTQDYSYRVIMDVVRRYNVDGIHFDDYFYPYPSYNDGKDFPDENNWRAYQDRGGALSRPDWRRDAVNTFIERVYTGIKAEKREVKFGLSPFGIWRPGYPASITGLDQYTALYADSRLWLNRGWVDYYSPQLYWPIQKTAQSFPALLKWWSEQNHQRRHLWPGINVSLGTQECVNQIMLTRTLLPAYPGVVHWHAGILEKDNGQLAKALRTGPYAADALVPASPWLNNKPPARPRIKLTSQNNTHVIHFSHPDSTTVFRWVAYFKTGDTWQHQVLNRKARTFSIPAGRAAQIGVSAVDHSGNESEISFFNLASN